ncbi:MAG: hypothetical protein LBC10_03840 [Deltaproteobacteria bacterium]|jgi:hypothetical protein|nr:hypothetical protein [Deltaproteobacteria bacterium]
MPEHIMPDCLIQLDAILSLAETEYAALLDGDLETVERICAERDRMLVAAMSLAEKALPGELYNRLAALQDIQQKLHAEAARQREDLRGQLFASRQEARRLSGYRKCVNMALT